MSRREAVVLGSRLLAVLMTVWALTDVCSLPSSVYAFLRYADQGMVASASLVYWRHHYLIELGFLTAKIVGYSLMANWLYRCGPDIEELLLPSRLQDGSGN